MTQFVACKFKGVGRPYTYRNDGDPLAVGDLVKVASKTGDTWIPIEVVMIMDDEPTFDCKPILGKIEPEQGDLLEA